MDLIHIATRSGRLSTLLREDMKLSAGLMNRLKWRDQLFVNGIPRHTDHPVSIGDQIRIPLDDPTPDYPAQEGALTVLYEDAHYLAVDKPAGMLIHPSRSQNQGTLANLVIGYYQKTGQSSAFHPITRLDRDTFGIVLVAKNSHAHSLLQTQPLQKIYHAITCGSPTTQRGTIDAPIARKPLPSLLREIREDGKPSVTNYEILDRFGMLCKLSLEPVTGRTHQLRLHCAHMGHPILGDPQYFNQSSQALSHQFGLTYQLLCAHQLSFRHPFSGEMLQLFSKMDVHFPKAE